VIPDSRQARVKRPGFCQFAFPHNDDVPAQLTEFSPNLKVTFHVPGEFRGPIFRSSFRRIRESAVPVSVPETAVNEYDGSVFWQDYVGLARKVGAVQSKPKSHLMEQ
jgi:hypothetical protein